MTWTPTITQLRNSWGQGLEVKTDFEISEGLFVLSARGSNLRTEHH